MLHMRERARSFVTSNQNSGAAVYSYVYDRFGNRWQQNGPASPSPIQFTGNNPGSPANTNRIDGYSYDTAGNLTYDGIHTFTYDAENRLISVVGGMTNSTYSYDADGRRIVKTGDVAECAYNGTTYYLYDIQGHSSVYTNSGTNGCRDEIFAGNRHLATYAPDTSFVQADWLGTERVRRAYATQISQTCTSLPFGDNLACAGAADPSHYSSPLHFTGKERDAESGLDNFGARYDSSSMGRFMSPDPANVGATYLSPQTWNAYSYVANNPLNAIDPTGLDCIYINNDTGQYEGFNRGDCDNSTEEKANSGYYVDGTVNTITTTTGDANGVVTGYNGTSDSGALLAGTFSTPGNNSPSDALNANAVAIFSQINRMNIINNTLKIYGAGALIGATGGAACYYFCPAASATTLAGGLEAFSETTIQATQELAELVQTGETQQAEAIVREVAQTPEGQGLLRAVERQLSASISQMGGAASTEGQAGLRLFQSVKALVEPFVH